MTPEPKNLNLHPEDPPVLSGQESRQGKLYERKSSRRWLALIGLMALVTLLAVLIYFIGGASAPPAGG